MKSINIHEAKTHLSRLLEKVARGEEIIIAKSGNPVARLIPYTTQKRKRQFGKDRGLFQVADDFDAPLPEEVIDSFEA